MRRLGLRLRRLRVRPHPPPSGAASPAQLLADVAAHPSLSQLELCEVRLADAA